MRTNLPVTQNEYQFPGSETLLSTTDTSSHITYANAAFIRTSGYDTEQLMGQPHNMVRHPDMPVEAFADMWRSLKSGQSWRALVKNRRQDGDHYWVVANAAPMRRNGQVTLLNQAGARGENLGSITSALLRLVDRYGATDVQMAVLSALARKVPHPNAVRLALEAQREARQEPAPVAVQLSEKVRLPATASAV